MRRALVLVSVCLSLFGCARSGPKPGEGFIEVPGGRVWYRVVGSGPRTPLLLLHGGPGVPSYYLKPLAALADERPVIFYDQLGCGHSDHPTDSTLWTVDRYVEELDRVRQALGLKQVHLLGHSWGTILANEYVHEHPEGVRSVIMAGPAISISRWIRDADSLRKTMPDSFQVVVARHEADGSFDSPEYQNAMMSYYHRYVSRLDPWPADIDSTFAQMGMSPYLAMDGPSEFTITGSLKTYEGVDRLANIHVPLLFICGQYDEATPATGAYYQSRAPGSKLAIIEGGAHLAMEDQPQHYVEVVRQFLRDVERR